MVRLLLVLLFTTLMAFSAFVPVKVPFLTYGMPRYLPSAEALYQWHGLVFGSHVISAQLPTLWLAGAVLGARRGGLAMALYLALGLGGLSIFAQGGGFGYIKQGTFGYLLAFIPAAIAIGHLGRGSRFGRQWLAMVIGLAIVQGLGLTYELVAGGQWALPSSWLGLAWDQIFQFLPGHLALLTAIAFVVASWRKGAEIWSAWTADKQIQAEPPLLPDMSAV